MCCPQLSEEKAIFLFVNDVLPPSCTLENLFQILFRIQPLLPVLPQDQPSFIAKHVSNSLLFVSLAVTMSDIYAKYKDEDGFLYITYSGESTFGH